MKNAIIIKFILAMTVLLILIQCIYVLSAQQDETPAINKELKMPAPALPAL